MAEIILTADNFEAEVLKSDIPVLVDFWATWCGPCMMLAPTIEELSHELAGKVKVCKVNVDEQPLLATQFKIVSIPTLLLFDKGEIKASSLGYLTKDQLKSRLGI